MILGFNLELERCPHCSVYNPNLSIVGGDIGTQNYDGSDERTWKIYTCSKCAGVVSAYSTKQSNKVVEYFPSQQAETFEYEYLDGDVADDFKEALKCYSNKCYNAFAAMCRRTIQSAATALGAEGKDRVTKQITDLKELVEIDPDTYSVLEQIIVAGHDGAHPHLPKLSPERSVTLLELMKDVLNELFVRKAKIKKSLDQRIKDISDNKSKTNSEDKELPSPSIQKGWTEN